MSDLKKVTDAIYHALPSDLAMENGINLIGKGLATDNTISLFFEGDVEGLDLESFTCELKFGNASELINEAAQKFLDNSQPVYIEQP